MIDAFASRKMRIVSLVPSITELLFALGLGEEVVGITKFCIHPERWFRIKTRIGGTKNVDIARVALLQPDLIIANKEENVKEQVEQLAARFDVLVTDVNNVDQALEMIRQIGIRTNRAMKAATLLSDIKDRFDSLRPVAPQPVAYMIWKDPWMTVGGDTFINDMLLKAGFKNRFAHRTRYPVIGLEELASPEPFKIFLSSEPYPFKEKHATAVKQLVPNAELWLVDGTLFSWYGSRMLQAPSYFRKLNPLL
ncbi:MAG: ABC transporter substrate-binding protein [Niabella sp.]|nr:ABC transporter substrate-binding protein [Niabella sp.]